MTRAQWRQRHGLIRCSLCSLAIRLPRTPGRLMPRAATTRKPKRERLRDRMPTRAELMSPKPQPWWTCGRCHGSAIFFPSPYVEKAPGSRELVPTGTGTLVCPHCSTMPKEHWPESLYGTVVKACGCGRADCPVNVVGAPLPPGQPAVSGGGSR